MNKNHSHCLPAATLLPTRAADKPRNPVTSTKRFNSFSSWPKLVGLFAAIAVSSLVETVPAAEQKPSIPIIVKDTTTYYWQIVLAGARKAGRDLNVNVPQLGAQSESDINGQISILENVVSEKPAAIVISPTQFKALGKPIDEAAKNVKIIGIDSAADSKAFTSFLTTDNVQGGRIAADALAAAITAKYGKPEGQVALITSIPGVGSLDQRGQRLQGGNCGQISRPETGCRQGCGWYAHHWLKHHDRSDHSHSGSARRFCLKPDHGAGRGPSHRRE